MKADSLNVIPPKGWPWLEWMRVKAFGDEAEYKSFQAVGVWHVCQAFTCGGRLGETVVHCGQLCAHGWVSKDIAVSKKMGRMRMEGTGRCSHMNRGCHISIHRCWMWVWHHDTRRLCCGGRNQRLPGLRLRCWWHESCRICTRRVHRMWARTGAHIGTIERGSKTCKKETSPDTNETISHAPICRGRLTMWVKDMKSRTAHTKGIITCQACCCSKEGRVAKVFFIFDEGT